jgi:hypothetical protein
MTETLALEGLGAKIRFNASGFESDLIALTLSPKARATIDTTHLGTEVAKTKRPGQTQDLGTIEAVFDHDPAAVSLVGRPAEQVIITYPENLGHEFDPIVLWAFATEQGGERMFPDGRMVTAITLSLSVPQSVVVVEDAPPPALVDPTKWLGAWDVTAFPSTMPNTVTTASMASMNYAGAVSIVGNRLKMTGPSAEISAVGTISGTQFSISFFARTQAFNSPHYIAFGAGSSFIFWLTYPVATTKAFGNTISGYSRIDAGKVNATTHYTITMDGVSGEFLIYQDGVLYQALSCGTGTMTQSGFSINHSGGDILDEIYNITLYNGIFSPAAVSSLAAGNMPSADGSLSP